MVKQFQIENGFFFGGGGGGDLKFFMTRSAFIYPVETLFEK